MPFEACNRWAWAEENGQSGDREAIRGEVEGLCPLLAQATSSFTPQTSLDCQLCFPPKDQQVPLLPDSCLITEPEEAVPRSGPLVGTASLRAALQFPALTGTLSYKRSCARGIGHQKKPTP